jgi:starch-binding outer membrane protein, SusD/RagB family
MKFMKHAAVWVLLMMMLITTSCDKYLDKEPDNRTTINTPEQLAQLLTTAYPQGNYIPFCESMSDNSEDRGAQSTGIEYMDRINRSSYRFEVVETAPDETDGPDYYWASCYKAIAAANQALQIIDAAADKAALTAQRGEALVARAYAHFMLVTLFAKPYNATTSANDPGIPYVTTPETKVFQSYERKTVAFVYENIEKDFLEGYPLLNDKIYSNAPAFHFTRAAASAFGARLYLFKREYDKVIAYANTALPGTVAQDLRPWNTTFRSLPYNELQADYTKSTTKGNLLLQESSSVWGRSYPNVRYGMGQTIANYFLLRPNATGSTFSYTLYGSQPRFYNIPKFFEHFVTETINATTGIPYNTVPLLTAEEALLNRAEAYLLKGDRNSAIDDLNIFASRNVDDYSAMYELSSSKLTDFYGVNAELATFYAILDFKQAFFLHEGLRWLDVIRLNIPVQHITEEGDVFTLDSGDVKRQLQLPALTRQAGLEPNPR